MVINVKDLERGLKRFRLTKKSSNIVCDVITKQLFLYRKLKLDPSNVSLIVVSKKIEGVDVIRVFEKNNVVMEIIDTSYTRFKNLASLEDWNTDFIFWISFLDEGKFIDIVKCKLSDIENIKAKKVKSTIYGITDGEDVVRIEISLQDIKGAEYEVLKDAIAYTFNKSTGKNLKELDCMVVGYC